MAFQATRASRQIFRNPDPRKDEIAYGVYTSKVYFETILYFNTTM